MIRKTCFFPIKQAFFDQKNCNARVSTCDFLDHIRRQGKLLAACQHGQCIVHLLNRWPLEAQDHLRRLSCLLLVLLLPSSNGFLAVGRFSRHERIVTVTFLTTTSKRGFRKYREWCFACVTFARKGNIRQFSVISVCRHYRERCDAFGV